MSLFRKVGETEDGKDVVSGVFQLYATHGVPLDVIFEFLQERKMIPSWIHFCLEAAYEGMSNQAIYARIEESTNGVYEPAFRDVILTRLKNLLKI